MNWLAATIGFLSVFAIIGVLLLFVWITEWMDDHLSAGWSIVAVASFVGLLVGLGAGLGH
jgi:uncharacterized membrane-anchored protein YitT (DUF2179 family)